MFFLNLWEPHANYFYPAGEAKAWADYFGGMRQTLAAARALDLPRYYDDATTCCTRWRTTRGSSPLHKAYAEQELGGIDDALHLLVYDILHTAYAGSSEGGYTRGSTSRARKGCEGEGGPPGSASRIGEWPGRGCRSAGEPLLRCPT